MGLRLRFKGLGFRALGFGFRASGCRFTLWIEGLGFMPFRGALGSGLRVMEPFFSSFRGLIRPDKGRRGKDLGFRVSGL